MGVLLPGRSKIVPAGGAIDGTRAVAGFESLPAPMYNTALQFDLTEKKMPTRLSYSPLIILVLLLVSACSSNADPVEEPPTAAPAVVVFATEDPNATPIPIDTPTPAASTPAPTVSVPHTPTPRSQSGMGVSASPGDSTAIRTLAEFEAYVENRPADINPLTGLPVDDPALLDRRPLMVRVGNDPEARPQVALNTADMVYEEITEWWVTRYTAIFLSSDPQMIAPVRSARLISLPLTQQYQGALASSGGSDGVRWELSQTDIVNLDELFVPSPYFYRENEGWQTRLAFDATVARDYLAEEELETDVNLRGFLFADKIDEAALGQPPGVISPAQEVYIPFPQATSKATWQFDAAAGKYLRLTMGEPHMSLNNGQIAADNVIIYFADHQQTDIVEDSRGSTSIRMAINGRGAAWLLRDGKILKGNWETDGTETPLFVFDDGTPMPLKPGNTWVQVVPLEFFITVDGSEYSSLPEALPAEGQTPGESAAETTPVDPTATTPPEASPTSTPIGARPASTPGSQ